jgi:phosphotriesterase-related protein
MEIGLRQLDILEAAGARLPNVAIGHMCCLDDPMVSVAKRIAARGAFVAFDRVTRQQQWVPDARKVRMVQAMLDAGLVDRLLISSDYIGRVNTAVGEINACGRLHAREGGPGYARPMKLFLPLLRKAGVSEAAIRRLTVDNPRRFLAFVPVGSRTSS